MPVERPKLRLGILLDSGTVSKYVLEFIRWCHSHDQLEISHVFVRSTGETVGRGKGGTPDKSTLLFRLTVALEKLLLLKNKRHFDHLRSFDLSKHADVAITHLTDQNDSAFENPNIDLLVTFTEDCPSNLVAASRLGAILLINSDDRIYRAGPAGFWEVYFRDDVTGFSIRHLAAVMGRPADVLMRGRTATQHYFLLNQASLFEKSSYYLRRIVEKIAATDRLPDVEQAVPFCHRPRGLPNGYETLIYLMGLIHLTTQKIIQKLRGFDFRWHVGYVRSDWKNAELWRANVIDNPPGHYLADPFVITKNGKEYCFVEDYDEAAKRAKITAYELGSNGATYLGVALQEDFHLSYPFLFEYQGQLYMCPETSECREIRVYECLEFPLRWQLKKVIKKDISAVDTVLFEKDGKWWMLTNIDPAGWNDFSLELHLFSASSPFDSEWKSHPLNPLIVDAARGRNGGMVRDGDRLFRVAQGQGFGMYGKRTSVNEITLLNDERYHEECVCVVSPDFKNGLFGTHHLHSNGRATIVDFATT